MRIISPAEAIPIWLPFWFLYHRNWSTPDFTEGLEYLRRNPALFDRRHLLSDHNGKQVWHIQLPPEYGGRNVVYKSCSTPKSGRYWFQLSQAAREHRNYQLLYRLGIPAARILAIGESRRLFNLKSFFIVTEFIPGARDGRDFMCGGNLREDAARRRQFWERNMPYLAQIHRRGFLHKAFHPRNILWRENAAGEMEIFWIDMARGRFRLPSQMKPGIAFDLYTLLKDLQLLPEEGEELLNCYLKHNPDCGFTLPELFGAMRNFRRRSSDPTLRNAFGNGQ